MLIRLPSEFQLWLIIFVISIWLYLVARSATSAYCNTELGLLTKEAQWMTVLAILQITRALLFSIWEFLTSTNKSKKEDGQRQSHSAYDAMNESITTEQSNHYAMSHQDLIYKNDTERNYINHYLKQ